jgi:DNA-binding transcriptional LysR family regulator
VAIDCGASGTDADGLQSVPPRDRNETRRGTRRAREELMNTEFLKTFIALVQHRNFTKTAQELLITQSAVSSRIKKLETEIGQVLFIRNKSNVILTNSGKVFLSYAIKMLKIQEAAVAEIHMSAKYNGNLNIYCAHSLFDCYILSKSIKFIENNPTISLKINLMHSSEIISFLGNENIDVAYLNYPCNHPKYICDLFIKERVVLVTNSKNTEYKNGIERHQINNLPIIFSDITEHTGEKLLSAQALYPLDINIVSRIIPFLKKGNWYCFLPFGTVQKDIKEGTLIEIPIKNTRLIEKQSYIIYKKNYKESNPLSVWLKS